MRTAFIRSMICSGWVLVAGFSPFAFADTHALIMTIGKYREGIPQLNGVKYDAESARAIARDMGVRESDIVELHDQQLTLDGMRKAFDDLVNRVQPNDRVFIYYSGHGGRQLVDDPQPRCAESLVTQDGYAFIDAELEAKLKAISAKAQKVIVFLDACHSGGVTTRAIGAANRKFSPKYWAKGGEDACGAPVNVLTRSIRLAHATGSGAQNYVYIAAAKDDEVSFDQPGVGGVATRAWLACLAGEAKDLDGSGGITADEIRQCAQQKVDATLKDAEGIRPPHIAITGNADAVLRFADAQNTSSADTDGGASGSGAAPATNPVSVTPAPYATLRDIYNGRDDRRTVTLQAAKPALQIGKDPVEFTLTSNRAGYVYLFMVGSDNKSFDLLFPNKLDRDHYIEAGQSLRLPRSSWAIEAQGPAGTDHLLAIVADAPRDFSTIGLAPAGPFSVVEASPTTAKDIQLVTSTSSNASSSECANATHMRNLAVARRCSSAYGAALLSVDEVP